MKTSLRRASTFAMLVGFLAPGLGRADEPKVEVKQVVEAKPAQRGESEAIALEYRPFSGDPRFHQWIIVPVEAEAILRPQAEVYGLERFLTGADRLGTRDRVIPTLHCSQPLRIGCAVPPPSGAIKTVR